MNSPAIYLAGPTVFLPDPERIFDRMKAICRRHGLVGVSPLDSPIATCCTGSCAPIWS
jgi:nucleoside 2-deoxyribosyltransferase